MFFLSFPRTFLILPLCHTSTPSQPSSYLSLLFRYPSYHQSVNAGCTRIHRSHLDACFVRVHASARLSSIHFNFCHIVTLVMSVGRILPLFSANSPHCIFLPCLPPLPQTLFLSLTLFQVPMEPPIHAGCKRMNHSHLDACFVRVHASNRLLVHHADFCHSVALVKFFLSFLRTRLILSICLACPPLPHPPPIFASLSGNHQSAHAGCTRMQQLHLDVCFVHVHVSTLQSYIQFHFGHIVALVMSIS